MASTGAMVVHSGHDAFGAGAGLPECEVNSGDRADLSSGPVLYLENLYVTSLVPGMAPTGASVGCTLCDPKGRGWSGTSMASGVGMSGSGSVSVEAALTIKHSRMFSPVSAIGGTVASVSAASVSSTLLWSKGGLSCLSAASGGYVTAAHVPLEMAAVCVYGERSRLYRELTAIECRGESVVGAVPFVGVASVRSASVRVTESSCTWAWPQGVCACTAA